MLFCRETEEILEIKGAKVPEGSLERMVFPEIGAPMEFL